LGIEREDSKTRAQLWPADMGPLPFLCSARSIVDVYVGLGLGPWILGVLGLGAGVLTTAALRAASPAQSALIQATATQVIAEETADQATTYRIVSDRFKQALDDLDSCKDNSRRIISYSFNEDFKSSPASPQRMALMPGSFVFTCIKAESDGHHLEIRPDDIYQAILLQLGVFKSYEEVECPVPTGLSSDVQLKIKLPITPFLDKSFRKINDVRLRYGMSNDFNNFEANSYYRNEKVRIRRFLDEDFTTTRLTDKVIEYMLHNGYHMQARNETQSEDFGTEGVASVTVLGELGDWDLLWGGDREDEDLPPFGPKKHAVFKVDRAAHGNSVRYSPVVL
jgi:hypothetical protein